MINLPPIIERIKALLSEDTDASVTYAALEARLALEKVVYDRLRQRHDYISHEELRKWQPGAVVTTLMQEVDPHIADGMTLSIGSPASDGVKPEDDTYVKIGTELGFNSKRIAKMWQALAKLALHVRLPEHKDDHIPDYGDKAAITAKVGEVVTELERLSKGTMTFSGLGMEVSFVCTCGTKNKRREALLREGKHVYCINPQCDYTWKAVKDEDGFSFESVSVTVNCENQECRAENLIPWRFITRMKYDEVASFTCHTCQHKNHMKWHLMQARREKPEGAVS